MLTALFSLWSFIPSSKMRLFPVILWVSYMCWLLISVTSAHEPMDCSLLWALCHKFLRQEYPFLLRGSSWWRMVLLCPILSLCLAYRYFTTSDVTQYVQKFHMASKTYLAHVVMFHSIHVLPPNYLQ